MSTTHLSDTHLCVDVGNLLNGTSFSRAAVLCSDDAAIRALAELLDELVLGVDDEGRVEGGEGVPLHGGQERRREDEAGVYECVVYVRDLAFDRWGAVSRDAPCSSFRQQLPNTISIAFLSLSTGTGRPRRSPSASLIVAAPLSFCLPSHSVRALPGISSINHRHIWATAVSCALHIRKVHTRLYNYFCLL